MVPFLIFAILQLLAINTVDLYSSGVTLQALGVPVKRWGAVIIDSVVCGVVVGIIVFHGNFYNDFAGFLLYIIVWLSAWFGVFITDYVLRRRRYDPASLAAERGGLYWRNGGVHWPAIIALAAGMVGRADVDQRGLRRAVLHRPDLQPLPRPGRRRLQLGARHHRELAGLLGAGGPGRAQGGRRHPGRGRRPRRRRSAAA